MKNELNFPILFIVILSISIIILGVLPFLWALHTASQTLLFIFESVSSPTFISSSKSNFKIVSNIIGLPSCKNCPRECKSLVLTVEIGKIPNLFFPSLSPNNCFSHSV